MTLSGLCRQCTSAYFAWKNNIARQYIQVPRSRRETTRPSGKVQFIHLTKLYHHLTNDLTHKAPANVVIIGCAALDITAQENPDTNSALARHSTAPGQVRLSLGGVARNIAEAAHRVIQAKFPALSSMLLAPIGRDAFGHLLVDEHAGFGMRTDGLVRLGEVPTAVCSMVLDSAGTLVGGVADMSIMDSVTGADVSGTL